MQTTQKAETRIIWLNLEIILFGKNEGRCMMISDHTLHIRQRYHNSSSNIKSVCFECMTQTRTSKMQGVVFSARELRLQMKNYNVKNIVVSGTHHHVSIRERETVNSISCRSTRDTGIKISSIKKSTNSVNVICSSFGFTLTGVQTSDHPFQEHLFLTKVALLTLQF